MRKILKRETKQSRGRRNFIVKASQVVGSIFVGIVAGPRVASACTGCCGLCESQHGFTIEDCDACIWSWMCPDNIGPAKSCEWVKCEECIQSFTNGCTSSWCANPQKNGNPCVTCGDHVRYSKATFQGTPLIPNCTPA